MALRGSFVEAHIASNPMLATPPSGSAAPSGPGDRADQQTARADAAAASRERWRLCAQHRVGASCATAPTVIAERPIDAVTGEASITPEQPEEVHKVSLVAAAEKRTDRSAYRK
jgi:hypothetical protein